MDNIKTMDKQVKQLQQTFLKQQQKSSQRWNLHQRLTARLALEAENDYQKQKADLSVALERMPLGELEDIVENLRVDLEKAVHFVNDQEEELTLLSASIVKLEEKLKIASDYEGLSLQVELANELERQEMLGATLIGQRSNLRKREAIFNQHWQILRRRQGVFATDDYTQTADLQLALGARADTTEDLIEAPASHKPWLRWVLALAVLGALTSGATLFYGIQFKRQQPVISSTISEAAPIHQSVAALGYLEPKGEIVTLSAPASSEGSRVDQLLVKLGDRVRAGQIIAVLDSRDRLQAALEQAKTDVTIAQARLAQVKAGAKQGDIEAQDAKFERTQAELEGQIATQRATIERIKAELNNAQTDCSRYQTLFNDGAVSAQERDRICLEAETTQKRLQEAQANLERTTTTLKRQIAEDRATREAVAQVRPVDVKVGQAQLQSAQKAVKKAQADLNLAYVRSPRPGTILKIHTWAGEMVGERGIVELGQTDQMYVRAEVYETDITHVRIGQRATIKSDGIVGDLQGVVAEIGLQVDKQKILGTDPTADTDARVVEVKIRLDRDSAKKVAGLTNLQVNVIINTSTPPATYSKRP
jgi:ABC exporter DevB family membrane fusion protein